MSQYYENSKYGTGRQIYQFKQQIDGIEKQIDSTMNKENPATVEAVFESGYGLVPSDNIRITNNIEALIFFRLPIA